jgi:SPP1 family predicted phage head-tail adaptor
MQAGKLDRQVVIKTKTDGQDGAGGATQTYTPLDTVWAEVSSPSGRQMMAGAEVINRAEMRFRMRYRSDFDETARIEHEGRDYVILHIAEIGRREGLDILAKRP